MGRRNLPLASSFSRDFFAIVFRSGVCKENRSAVLGAEIGALAVHLRGIVDPPKHIQELFLTHLCRVKRHFDYLGVAGFIATNILVARIFRVSAAVAHLGSNHSGHALERGLYPPGNILRQMLQFRPSNSPFSLLAARSP